MAHVQRLIMQDIKARAFQPWDNFSGFGYPELPAGLAESFLALYRRLTSHLLNPTFSSSFPRCQSLINILHTKLHLSTASGPPNRLHREPGAAHIYRNPEKWQGSRCKSVEKYILCSVHRAGMINYTGETNYVSHCTHCTKQSIASWTKFEKQKLKILEDCTEC